jgi:hypothetical protein
VVAQRSSATLNQFALCAAEDIKQGNRSRLTQRLAAEISLLYHPAQRKVGTVCVSPFVKQQYDTIRLNFRF